MKKTAYTLDGDWIGNSKEAYRLCAKRGIKPEKRKDSSCVCSIGFSEKEQKWYGWSYRAIYGFGIGSEVKIGDCAYVPKTFEGIKNTHYFGEPCHLLENDKCRATGKSKIETKDSNEDNELVPCQFVGWEIEPSECCKNSCIFQTGNGEWDAKTLKDAKQMACDFAEGVS